MKTLSDYVLVTVMSLMLLMGELGFSKSDAEFEVEDFYVVGVIAEKSAHSEGIVVLRSKTGNKSFTLRGGQLLPADGNWVIENIKRKRVVVSAGDTRIVLPYGMKQMDGYVEKKEDRPEPRYITKRDNEDLEVDYVTEVYKNWIEKNKKSITAYKERMEQVDQAKKAESLQELNQQLEGIASGLSDEDEYSDSEAFIDETDNTYETSERLTGVSEEADFGSNDYEEERDLEELAEGYADQGATLEAESDEGGWDDMVD